jgi:hypothetical protein
MNKTISLAAIAMVAVIMGMSVLAPAMAVKPMDVLICHFDADGTVALNTVNTNSVSKHVGNENGDHENDEGFDFIVDGTPDNTVADCPVTIEVEDEKPELDP